MPVLMSPLTDSGTDRTLSSPASTAYEDAASKETLAALSEREKGIHFNIPFTSDTLADTPIFLLRRL